MTNVIAGGSGVRRVRGTVRGVLRRKGGCCSPATLGIMLSVVNSRSARGSVICAPDPHRGRVVRVLSYNLASSRVTRGLGLDGGAVSAVEGGVLLGDKTAGMSRLVQVTFLGN